MTISTWKNGLWYVIDTETTGLKAGEDRIVELATVTMLKGKVLNRRQTLLNPGIPIPEGASKVHGITDEMVADAPRIEDIAEGFLALVRKMPVLVAYNAPFDLRFLRAELGEAWDEATAHAHVIDPLAIVRTPEIGKFWKGSGRHKLVAVAERFGVGAAGDAHRAAYDAELAGLVLHHLLEVLPDDPAEAARAVVRARDAADVDYAAWKARTSSADVAAGCTGAWHAMPDSELI